MNSKLAGVMQVRNYDPRWHAFEQLKELCDYVCVLDNNSARPFLFAHQCDDFLSLKTNHEWNCTANLTHLMYQAFVRGCEWVLHLDDDMVLNANFRKDVRRLIESQQRVLWVWRRDLWGNPVQVRCDGFWKNKSQFPVLFKNWFFDKEITVRRPHGVNQFHSDCIPENTPLEIAGLRLPDEYCVYHAGNITRADRITRVEQLKRIDPHGIWRRNYDYLLDESELELETVTGEDAALLSRP